METSKSQSILQDIRLRELSGIRVCKRPLFSSGTPRSQAVAIGNNTYCTVPLAVSFCKSIKSAHILAVSDEDGFVRLFNTRLKSNLIPQSADKENIDSDSIERNAEKSKVSDWAAHQNSIYDICWIKDDSSLLTGSADQTIKVWDVEHKKCSGELTGHTASVKSICSHPTNSDLVVSGSRDASFALWDLRCRTSQGKKHTAPTKMVSKAHFPAGRKRISRFEAASRSVTSVLYLKDEVSVATAGAADSIVKFWDTRNLRAQVTQTFPDPASLKENMDSMRFEILASKFFFLGTIKGRSHGITSLSQDQSGVLLSASCTDSRIYLYNVLQLDKGPISSFSGSRIETFYVKSMISPDASHILGGSTDGNAYIWQVNQPQVDPIALKSHDEEVTAVDWCLHEIGKIATASDDYSVRFWNIQNSCCTSPSPSIRRRVSKTLVTECKKLVEDGGHINPIESPSSSCPPNEVGCSTFNVVKTIATPESQKHYSLVSSVKETLDRTPKNALRSPTSVLTPPSMKKRTIKDYFLAAS